jgi:hypothetical protein
MTIRRTVISLYVPLSWPQSSIADRLLFVMAALTQQLSNGAASSLHIVGRLGLVDEVGVVVVVIKGSQQVRSLAFWGPTSYAFTRCVECAGCILGGWGMLHCHFGCKN